MFKTIENDNINVRMSKIEKTIFPLFFKMALLIFIICLFSFIGGWRIGLNFSFAMSGLFMATFGLGIDSLIKYNKLKKGLNAY